MKKFIVLISLLTAITSLSAQEEGKIRGSFDFGGSIPGGGFGLFSGLEINYNISEDMRAGLRAGSGVFVRDLEFDSSGDFESGDFSTNFNFLATYDYCFNNGESFVPYVGAGVGVYSVAAYGGRSGEDFEFSVLTYSTNFGGAVRGGFELGKFRMGLEYNFIPSTPLLNAEGTEIGNMNHSYFGVSVGFFVGGGWWGQL